MAWLRLVGRSGLGGLIPGHTISTGYQAAGRDTRIPRTPKLIFAASLLIGREIGLEPSGTFFSRGTSPPFPRHFSSFT